MSYRIRHIALALLTFFLLSLIPFSNRKTNFQHPAKAVAAPFADSEGELKIFITSAIVSERGLQVYRDLAAYLSNKTGRKMAIVSGASYHEINLLLDHGAVHIGFICGLPFTQKVAEGKVLLVATPVSAIRTGEFADAKSGYENTPGKYYSYTIVHKDSKLRSWADLKGKRYAFNDIDSNSGYNMPRYKLIQLGAKSWESYFSKIVVSGSHEESIRMVAQGRVDASSVDSLILDYDRLSGNPDAHKVRIIEQMFPGGAGAPPIVVTPKVSTEFRKMLQGVLVNMHRDPNGKKILSKALLLRFDPPDDHNYDDIRRMQDVARKARFRDFDVR